jgi:putative transposase
MNTTYSKENRSVYLLTVHIVFVTKYRRKSITSEILSCLERIFADTCGKWECRLVEFNGETDHVHLLVEFNPKVQLSKFIANLKTVSSRLIRKDYSEYLMRFYGQKPVFWTASYFVATCGGVTIEQLKKYVEKQQSPV